MDHHERHHEHKEKERERRDAEKKAHEHAEEAKLRVIHPLWFLVVGTILTLGVVLAWTMS